MLTQTTAGSIVLQLPYDTAEHETPAENHTYTLASDSAASASESESDAAPSDTEEHGAADETVSSAESKHEEDDDAEIPSSSSDDADDVASEDGDFEVDEDAPVVNGYSDSEKSEADSQDMSADKGEDNFYENPDLYGLRRSVCFGLPWPPSNDHLLIIYNRNAQDRPPG